MFAFPGQYALVMKSLFLFPLFLLGMDRNTIGTEQALPAMTKEAGEKMGKNTILKLLPISFQACKGYAEIQGVGAGPFNPALWEKNTLNWVPEFRHPLIPPRLSGPSRNIYAPSAVWTGAAWRLFYGAWDGVPTGNDRIYSVTTQNFLDFDDWKIVIEHGMFQHVCNVSAVHTPEKNFEMFCTVYPDELGLNKPAFFSSPDGESWNGSPQPYPAQRSDIVKINGYDKYPAQSDVNGGNVLLREDGKIRLYFHNFLDGGKVFCATSGDGKNFAFNGTALYAKHAWLVNDMKKFHVDERDFYLMGLHRNGPDLWYALSGDGLAFPEERKLFDHKDERDRFIVALGWVVRENSLLGVLYGAGDFEGLFRNRIFARWLQKRIQVKDKNGNVLNPAGSLGPDRALFEIPKQGKLEGTLILYSEDGQTKLSETAVSLEQGWIYEIDIKH